MLLLLDDDEAVGRITGVHFTDEREPVGHGADAASVGVDAVQHGAPTGQGRDAEAHGVRVEDEQAVTSRSSGEEEG